MGVSMGSVMDSHATHGQRVLIFELNSQYIQVLFFCFAFHSIILCNSQLRFVALETSVVDKVGNNNTGNIGEGSYFWLSVTFTSINMDTD